MGIRDLDVEKVTHHQLMMESPPSSSTWSEAFILSDDSGLLLTNESLSSGDSRNGLNPLLLEDSDCEEKSISQDSLDGMSDIMYSENFNTLKKGPNWSDIPMKPTSPIEPPLEFQDKPMAAIFEDYSDTLASQIVEKALVESKSENHNRLKNYRPIRHQLVLGRSYYTSDFMSFSPCHGGRPESRSSLGSSRLSSSHNSLSVPTARKADDSSFITQAVSHDTLSSNQISDLYNVPFDSDVYAVPVDVVKPPLKPRRTQQNKKRRRNTASGCRELESKQWRAVATKKTIIKSERYHWCLQNESKRHSVAGTSAPIEGEPIHMTLQEVRHYLQTLYSSSSDSSDHKERLPRRKVSLISPDNPPHDNPREATTTAGAKKNTLFINMKNKKVKDSYDNNSNNNNIGGPGEKRKKPPPKVFSLKHTLCNIFRFKKVFSSDIKSVRHPRDAVVGDSTNGLSGDKSNSNILGRALPPLPLKVVEDKSQQIDEQLLDFATSIQRVKDYGWYWGPLPSEDAEKILSNEPDGSFIVRDSSDDHYIFSLTFKLNNCVRHVRIDHDQGNFSFGNCTKFKSQTIVEFIENAVENSRSGRYLFFLHRRPVIGPVRVQLLHPVSRFKQVQSLQHICRFVIHKNVRRDLIPSLPLPRRMIDYLNTPHYYSEHFESATTTSQQVPQELAQSANPPLVNNYVELNGNNNNSLRQS